jgi:DNA mismatch repair ATPase MutS
MRKNQTWWLWCQSKCKCIMKIVQYKEIQWKIVIYNAKTWKVYTPTGQDSEKLATEICWTRIWLCVVQSRMFQSVPSQSVNGWQHYENIFQFTNWTKTLSSVRSRYNSYKNKNAKTWKVYTPTGQDSEKCTT